MLLHVIYFALFVKLASSATKETKNTISIKQLEEYISHLKKPRVLVILNSNKNIVNEITRIIQKKKIEKTNKKAVLIKRSIPHRSDEGEIEYNNYYKGFYKPLLRIHKTKPYHELEGYKVNNIDNIRIDSGNTDELTSKNVFKEFEEKYDLSKNVEDGQSAEVWNGYKFATNKENNYDRNVQVRLTPNENKLHTGYTESISKDLLQQLQILFDIYYGLKKIRSKSRKLKAYGRILPALNMIDSLRANFDKSGEAKDPFAKRGYMSKAEWMPYYPAWNWWTYKKTLLQDICPGNQVKTGNMCIWIPPH